MSMIDSPTVVIYEGDEPQSLLIRKCKLLMVSGPQPGSETIINRDLFTIGAHKHNDLVVEDGTVSGNHCEIQLVSEGFLIRDLQSTNGTFIQGVRISEGFLEEGSEFRLGKCKFIFCPLKESTKVEISQEDHYGKLIGKSASMKRVFRIAETYSPTDVTILITGSTGTGKELMAAEIHAHSKRAEKPFVVVDCSALSRGLIESELFGHTRGSFTGAMSDRKGSFESAHGGTIFLDEIGDLSEDLQPKLLRVLENKEIRRVGSNDIRKVDVRVLAATHRRLEMDVNSGRFREDLYFRLSVVKLHIPPLGDRKEDIPKMIERFVDALGDVTPDRKKAVVDRVLSMFPDYDWPGNVRELRNVVERTFHSISSTIEFDPFLMAERIGSSADVAGASSEPLFVDGVLRPFKEAKEQLISQFERGYIARLLDTNSGNISRSAREAQIERAYLQRLIKKHALKDG
jgi:transcriptional regulator with GAF, ATPase, and Fis domain